MPERDAAPLRDDDRIDVEIAGIDFVNMGAELMLLAVLAMLGDRPVRYRPSIALRRGDFARRNALAVAHLLRFGTPRFASIDAGIAWAERLVPPAVLSPWKLVRTRDVRVILDASGFAYSDQWSPRIADSALRYYRRWKRPGRRLVLLPQAFGPFRTEVAREHASELMRLADLVFARDEASYRHLLELDSGRPVHLAPDFTNLYVPSSTASDRGAAASGRVVIVPNRRMVDVGKVIDGERYAALLTSLVDVVRRSGGDVVFLAHEARDVPLVERLAVETKARAIADLDADAIKNTLGVAKLVVSSRFHGLVSALSQGTPSIALGWSHKYDELMREYGAQDALVAVEHAEAELPRVVKRELEADAQRSRRARLAERGRTIEGRAREMWDTVFELIEARGAEDTRT